MAINVFDVIFSNFKENICINRLEIKRNFRNFRSTFFWNKTVDVTPRTSYYLKNTKQKLQEKFHDEKYLNEVKGAIFYKHSVRQYNIYMYDFWKNLSMILSLNILINKKNPIILILLHFFYIICLLITIKKKKIIYKYYKKVHE